MVTTPPEGLPTGYAIRASGASDLEALPEIERAAAHLFEGMDLAPAVLDDVTTLAHFRAAHDAGWLWVATAPGGAPVGFAFALRLGAGAHLDELDVHPDHGRRGLGAALVRAVCHAAAERGLPRVTLTTFRDVAWNAPFYEKLGFRALAPDELSGELEALVQEEDEAGLPRDRRVVMCWSLLE